MKRRRKSNNFFLCFSRHPFLRLCHPTHWMLAPLTALLLALPAFAPPAGGVTLATIHRAAEIAAENGQRKKGVHQEGFLLFGTVFTVEGLALPGAEIRVCRSNERKARWEARSDRRGEFAVRVPQGAEYEMSVKGAGYQEQTQKIDARTGNRADLVFRLAPVPGRKPK